MSKKIVAPPNEDPIKWFERYRRKKIWQRPDWKKGVRFAGVVLLVLFAVFKVAGLF